jgi:hypothetical protein
MFIGGNQYARVATSPKQRTANMQFNNWHNLHSPNASSLVDGSDGSSVAQGVVMNGSADAPSLGTTTQEYLMNASGEVSPVYDATSHATGTASTTTSATGLPPPPTLIGSSNGLQFDLIWDSSVASAPNGFVQAIVDAAKTYSKLFSNKEVIAINVGYGEIAGTPMAPNALGESESFGYLTDYTTVTTVLMNDGFHFSATNEPTTGQFFITSADAKAMGLVDPASRLDGFMGFSDLSGTGFSWNTSNAKGPNTGIGPNQFDLEAAAAHEISEIMGRLGLEGNAVINGQPIYTPLDLFNYQSQGALELSANGGYFSVNDGKTNLGNYNNAAVNGGDIADWASNTSTTQSNTLGLSKGSQDAYDAFMFPGVNGQLSLSDIVEDAALGYKLTPIGNVALLTNYVAASFPGAPGLHGDAAAALDGQAANQQTVI